MRRVQGWQASLRLLQSAATCSGLYRWSGGTWRLGMRQTSRRSAWSATHASPPFALTSIALRCAPPFQIATLLSVNRSALRPRS